MNPDFPLATLLAVGVGLKLYGDQRFIQLQLVAVNLALAYWAFSFDMPATMTAFLIAAAVAIAYAIVEWRT